MARPPEQKIKTTPQGNPVVAEKRTSMLPISAKTFSTSCQPNWCKTSA